MKVVSQENLAYVIEKLKTNGTLKTPVINNLTSTNTTSALSAYQGKILNDGKVDKVSGKGLSTNDFTSAEKTKLAGIAEGANKYVLPVSSTTAIGGIKTGRDIKIDADNYAFLDWRTVNTAGNVPVLDGAYIDDLHHNKMAFLKAENIKVEYSTDGGTTWLDYGWSDEQKVKLVTLEASASIGAKTTGVTTEDRLRVTITAAPSQMYTSARKVLLNMSTNGANGSKVIFETRTINDYNNNTDTWTTKGTYDLSGWSGWNSIPFSVSFGGSTGQTTQIRQLRMTFSITSVNTNYNCNLSLLGIRLIGVTNWSSPSNMARNGHLYNFDYLQNAVFPAQVRTSATPVNSNDLTNKAYVDAQKFSGKYSDLTGKPTIPTKVSQLTNDSGFLTAIPNTVALKTDLPTKTSQLTNDSNFVVDSSYVHTDVNFTSTLKTKLDGIATGANKTVVDTALSSTSTNPVQNKVINTALGSYLLKTGTAASATKLATARKINGVAFDGTSDITISVSATDDTKLPLTGGQLTNNLYITGAEEGGELVLEAAIGNTTNNGLHIDNYNGTLRIFGEPSKDGTTKTGVGSLLYINPYGKDIHGDYNVSFTDMSVSNLYVRGDWTWLGGENFYLKASGNGQEWSFDLGADETGTTQTYTGTYAQFWSKRNEKTIIAFYNDDMSVRIPNGSLIASGEASIGGGLTVGGNISAGNVISFPNTGAGVGTWRGIIGYIGDNDDWVIRGSQEGSNSGFLEIATGDDGNEPILVRQYSGGLASANAIGHNVAREVYLLDRNGNSSFPGVVYAPTFSGYLSGNAFQATRVQNYDMHGATGSAMWCLLGTYTSAGDASNCIIRFNGGNGYNAGISQNSWFEMFIKDGWQQTGSTTSAFGVSIRGMNYGGCSFKVLATAHNVCQVWVYMPWGYWNGQYTFSGRGDWAHSGHYQSDAPSGVDQPIAWYDQPVSGDFTVRDFKMGSIGTWNSNYSGYMGGTVMFCWE